MSIFEDTHTSDVVVSSIDSRPECQGKRKFSSSGSRITTCRSDQGKTASSIRKYLAVKTMKNCNAQVASNIQIYLAEKTARQRKPISVGKLARNFRKYLAGK